MVWIKFLHELYEFVKNVEWRTQFDFIEEFSRKNSHKLSSMNR